MLFYFFILKISKKISYSIVLIVVISRVEMSANYIDLKVEPGKGLFRYEVKFSPEVDAIYLRRKLLNQHAESFGVTRTFDGALLYLPSRLPQAVSRKSLNFKHRRL